MNQIVPIVMGGQTVAKRLRRFGAGAKPLAMWDFTDPGILFADDQGTPAAIGDRVAVARDPDGFDLGDHDPANGMFREAGGLRGDGASTLMTSAALGAAIADYQCMIVMRLKITDLSNTPVLWTLDTNPEAQYLRSFTSLAYRVRSQSNAGSKDVDLGFELNKWFTLAWIYADGLYSLLENGELMLADHPYDLSAQAGTATRFHLGGDPNGLDPRNELIGEISHASVWRVA